MDKENKNLFSIFLAAGFLGMLAIVSIVIVIILKNSGAQPLTLGATNQLTTPTPLLQLDAQRKYEVPSDLKGLLTPTPGSDKINFEPETSPTPTPPQLFDGSTDIKLDPSL